jgi:flagellar hook-length control protein FliK
LPSLPVKDDITPTVTVPAAADPAAQAALLKAITPASFSQLLNGRSGESLAGDGQGLRSLFSTQGSLLDLVVNGSDELEKLVVQDVSTDASGLPMTGLPAPGPILTQNGLRPTQTLDLANLLQSGGETRLAEQVKWVMQSGLETVELKLHPPSLGALDVRVTMEADKAHVQFLSPHPIVREVLEAALPRLRDSLAQDGLLLGHVSISDQAAEGRRESAREQAAAMLERRDFDGSVVEDVEMPGRIDSTLSVLSRRHDYFV